MAQCRNCGREDEGLSRREPEDGPEEKLEGLCGPCYINALEKREEHRAGTPDRRRPIKSSPKG